MVAIAFSYVPLVVLLGSAAYALVMAYRLRDWRPGLFIVVLLMMAVHQVNEITVLLHRSAEVALAGLGEYPETAANLLASVGTVLLLRWVHREQELARQFEERVQERSAELESFTYSMSHDLRTPLRAIDGFTRMLIEDYEDDLDAEGQRLLNVVYESAQRMGRLIDDLLAFSRLGHCEMRRQPISMKRLAYETFDAVQQDRPHQPAQLRLHDLPRAEGDRAMVRRVFGHLVANAFKFTQHQRNAVVEIGTYQENGSTAYFVRDNGTGFDMDYADKLFGVFERLHDPNEFEGTGVGLAIVERIVRRHGGRVWAEGAVGEGATFYFTLPS